MQNKREIQASIKRIQGMIVELEKSVAGDLAEKAAKKMRTVRRVIKKKID